MQMQLTAEADVPLVNCPHCVKRWPMAIKSLEQSVLEFICANCGTTLVLPRAADALS